MNLLDIILLAPVLYGLIRGIFRGLVEELTAIVAIIVAVICAKLFAPQAATMLMEYSAWQEQICQVCAYLIIFFTVALIMHLVGKIVGKLLAAISLGWLNRLLGAVFGAAKWALIVSVLLNGAALLDNYFNFIPQEVKENSVAYEPVRKIASVAWDTVQNIKSSQEQQQL